VVIQNEYMYLYLVFSELKLVLLRRIDFRKIILTSENVSKLDQLKSQFSRMEDN